MFEIKNVSKQYGDEFALNDVSLNIGEGLNFIVGASGSGKTTLLKIISGMEQGFDGEVSFCGKDIKSLSENDKSYYYNNIFGFVWQDFNLLENSTVLENVLLPTYLKNTDNRKLAKQALKNLKILDIADKKVKYLSGGQKQRVAIARELMKNPQVIIADEPTSALDEKTSKTTMDILRALSKSCTVIVVTHDASLIADQDKVFELDKGELIKKPVKAPLKSHQIKQPANSKLSFSGAFSLAKINAKNKLSRFLVSVLSLTIASVLLFTTFGGMLQSSGESEFQELIKKYGEGLLDMSIASSFMSAGGTDGNSQNKPNADVSQDIGGLYEKYTNDERVQFALFLQAFDNIKIDISGKSHNIQSSGSVPVINKLLSGKMPNGNGNEVVVPESFVKQTGLDKDSILGKEIEFFSTMYNWDSGEPVPKEAKIKAKVVGVIDTTAAYEYEGKIVQYSVDDSFFFSKTAIDNMREQSGVQADEANFLIRAKTPSDMIAIKDEINKLGISPLGRFELVEDMVRLQNQTAEQSGFASVIIAALSVIMIAAVFFITGIMRKREYAICKVSGFSNKHLHILSLSETLLAAVCSVILLLIASPLLNFATESIFGVNMLNVKMLIADAALILPLSAVSYIVTIVSYIKINAAAVLKSGDR